MANMASALKKILNHCASHPDATIIYQASDMMLKTHSDSLYLNLPGACSQVRGHDYLGNDTAMKHEIYNGPNGPLVNTTGILKTVVFSPQKLNSVGYSSIPRKHPFSEPPLPNYATLNHPHLSLLTTLQPLAYPMTQSSSNDPALLTCISTGFRIT